MKDKLENTVVGLLFFLLLGGIISIGYYGSQMLGEIEFNMPQIHFPTIKREMVVKVLQTIFIALGGLLVLIIFIMYCYLAGYHIRKRYKVGI